MLAALETMLGRKARLEYIPRNPADVDANWANVDKACHLLDWEPRVGLAEGMQRLVDWYLAERAWASQILTP
jgi:UDP-glucuronate 4-epimerase